MNIVDVQDLSKVYDLTKVLDESTPVFPGDPSFEIKTLSTINNSDGVALQHLHFCNHTGTHIDFPAHVIENGKTSTDFNIQDLIGNCIVIDYDSFIQNGKILEKYLNEVALPEFVFFKNVTYLHEQVAEFLIQKKVKIVGVDSLSVDAINNHHLTVHNILLREDILIVENLYLDNISCGYGFVIVAPLNVANIDGVPARVIMWR